MARDTNQKIEGLAGTLCEARDKAARVRHGETVLAEMNATGAGRESDIDAVVHDDACAESLLADDLHCGAREMEAIPATQVFFAKLDPVDAGRGDGRDTF